MNSKFNICITSIAINLKIKYLSFHFDNFPNTNDKYVKKKYFFNRKECIFIFRSDSKEIIDFIRSCHDIFRKQLFDNVLQTILVPSSNRKTGLLFPIDDLSKVGSRVLSSYSLVYPINDSRTDHSGETQLSSLRIVPMAQNAF